MAQCESSPDKECHYDIDTDRDGIRCVVLKDRTMDHAFPRTDREPNSCLYCGKPRK